MSVVRTYYKRNFKWFLTIHERMLKVGNKSITLLHKQPKHIFFLNVCAFPKIRPIYPTFDLVPLLLTLNMFLPALKSCFPRNATQFKINNKHTTTIFATSLTHFMPLVSFYTPWKYQKNQRFSDVFKAYRKRPVARNGLKLITKASERRH